ncbi:hypothetical protein [Halobacillus sp. KGW1]|uniref:hypothetical protein n=1 Tax=Halobacillus sp. KGW1 TaxID=1793726 RepID=UPI0007850BA7|nr:hypothetical protein [Halobacillus sp. KGW1]
MMEFLYFPEDKSEYIPAVFMLLLFIVLASLAMIWIIRASQKEEKKWDKLEQTSDTMNREDQKPREGKS